MDDEYGEWVVETRPLNSEVNETDNAGVVLRTQEIADMVY